MINLPPHLTDEELEPLVARYRAGEIGLRNQIVESHLRLVYMIGSRYATNCPRKWQDIICESYFITLDSVIRFQTTGKDNCITPYIVSRLFYGLRDFIVKDRVIKVPPRTMRFKKLELPTTTNEVILLSKGAGHEKAVEFRELLEHLNNEERKILDLWFEGWSQKEIGELVSLEQTTVSRKLNATFMKIGAYYVRDSS